MRNSSASWGDIELRLPRGFTLLELLVSISIFSILGLSAYQMLQTVIDSNDRVRSLSEGVNRLNLTFSILQRDFNQFSPRQIRDQFGDPVAPLVFESEDYAVEFTRGGWSNPAGRSRSRMQRVAYSIDYEEDTLTRHFWEVLDRAEDSEPISQVLLEGVTDFRVTGFVDDSESSLESDFELDEQEQAAPIGVEVVIAVEGVGEVERLFQLIDPFDAASSGRQDEGNNNDEIDGAESEEGDGTTEDSDGTDSRAVRPGNEDDN